ncbi:MAG: hypothetical protein WBN11_07770, partial [Eudoraea sp.]|uniref:hypothetical protein n=1 Tax=Eudoraea sp. TaxID=1979955 RepID=UPI003C74AE5D
MNSLKVLLGCFFVLFCFYKVFAQQGAINYDGDGRPVAQAIAISTEPAIDGEVLDDPVWAALEAFGDFTQLQP